jgi:transcriptional regulator with XRE-family HTH domain
VATKTFRQRVGDRIRMARWRKKFDQEQAAGRIGLSYRYFAEVERGVRNPTLDVLADIAKGLDVGVVDLVDVEGRSRVNLAELDLEPPPRGRKPKPRSRAARHR